MAGPLDTLGGDIIAALKTVLQGAYNSVKDLTEKEAHYFETQAAMITKARISGEFDDDQVAWFLSKLEEDAQNFCRVLCAQTLLTLEKAWNAVVGVIWKAIDAALKGSGLGGIALPVAPSA
jgi:hypothetical protein